jgi:predicted DNA-binding transcriptional regulator YafY
MQLHSPTGPHFTPRDLPAEDIAAYVTRSVRSAPLKYETRAIVKASAQVITERVPHEIVVEPIDDNTCIVHARSNSVEMLALYLGMLDADFIVTAPPELVARMSTLAERYSAAVANVG